MNTSKNKVKNKCFDVTSIFTILAAKNPTLVTKYKHSKKHSHLKEKEVKKEPTEFKYKPLKPEKIDKAAQEYKIKLRESDAVSQIYTLCF